MNFRKICLNFVLVIASSLIGVTATDIGLGVLKNHGFSFEQVAHVPNQTEQRDNAEFNYEFATNSLGFRNTELAAVKAPESRRVMVVGDSFVEGFGVEQNETFTSHLSILHQTEGIDFINAGLSGQGPLKYKAMIKAFSLRLDVDAILVCLFANDLADMTLPPGYRWYEKAIFSAWPNIAGLAITIKRRGNKPLLDSTKQRINFVERVVSAANHKGLEKQLIEQWRTSLKSEWIEEADKLRISGPVLSFGLLNPQFWSESIDIDTQEAEEKWQLMQSTLVDIAKFARKNQKEFAVVYIPSVFQYDIQSFSDERPWPTLGSVLRKEWLIGTTEIQTRLSKLMDQENISFLDLTPSLRTELAESRQTLNFRYDEHFNKAGHKTTARLLKNWLEASEVFSFMQ